MYHFLKLSFSKVIKDFHLNKEAMFLQVTSKKRVINLDILNRKAQVGHVDFQ